MKKFFQNKIKLLISLTFLILFVFNTVAYSGLATKLAITSEAMFRPITDIRVTDIKLDSATNGAVESYSPKFNVDTTTTGFVLPNANSTITYKVKVTNYGNVNQTIYNFIKNSINSSNVNIKITDFTSVCADDSCSQKNSDFTIIHHNGDNTTDSNEKEILITFSTSAPSDQAINVIEKYDFRPIYNINYDANGGQNAPKSQIKIYKDNLTLTTDEPTRPSYKFLGWSTSSKSTTAEYKAGDSYNPGTNEEVKDIILYAVWKIDSYTLTINPNGGTWNNSTNKSTITQSYGSTYIIENPTKTGHTFTGWTLSGKGSLNGTTYTFGEGAATLTANYTANTYTITLDNKSATTAGTTAIYEKYGAGIYLDSALKNAMTTTTNKITVPAKTGYTFKGYYTKENGQGDQIINENGYITDKVTNTTYIANTTLYAYYKDETKPTLTLTNSSNGNWTNKDVTITLNGADSGSGIKEYQWKENGAWTTRAIAITNGVGSITYTVDRNLEIEFRTIDNAGNVSDTKTTYVRRDTITPKIELNGAASSSEINNNSVTIPIKITETASGINNSEFTTSDISVLINGTKVNPSTKTLTYNNVSNGIYSYTLTLSGITLNGKVTLEIAAGAVKDIATNSNSKTTLDPSITVSNIYTISLNGNGTPAIYEKYNTGIYLDSALTSAMTTSANPITKPIRSYTVSFNANNTGITMPSAITKSYSYSGHYTDASTGTQMINENGYITSSFTKTSYTANATLYAHWKAKPSVTIPSISKTGYTCSWNTSADGKGTTYNAGDVTDKLNTQTLYVVCKANSYTVSYNSNGGSGTMTNDTATYDSNFITKKNTFTKTGYTFNGWNEKADGTGTVWGLTTSGVYESGKTWKWTYTKNITLYAQWKANTNTKYVVKHYKQKLDGTYPSEADDTDNLTGTADSSVSPAIKSYAGFTAPSVQTVTISADGSTVVTYKYTRNKYTFTLGSTTGITTTGSTASGSYYYGSTITLKASANTGYIFTGWTSSNTNLVANQTTANTTFTMPAGNITMTPSVTVNSYTVTYDATTNGGSTAKQTASTKYKSLVDLTKKAEKSGYEFVGWNINKDATSALSSYEMPAKNVTLYAIYKKTLTATFNYYNSKSETRTVTIYNNATSGSITSPAALGTPSGYTFRHYSTSNVANAAKTIDANSAVVLTGNQTYYASYQKNVTLNFYYHSGTDAYANKQTSTTATGVQYLGYNNAIVNSTVSIPSAVAGSTGYYGTSYKGVTAANSTTPISVNTGTTNYYAYYQATITYYYYNGSAHTTGAGTRTAYSNGTNYVTTASAAPTPSSYDGAAFKGWSYTNDSVNDRNPAYTAMTALYAYYQKTVNATFNYYDGSKAASVTAGNTRTYISKSGGVNTINTNITIPDAAKASRGSYTYRGISTSNAANASVVTPTTANTTYYSSYTYAITANFTANGGTGTAPSSAAGTGYMNYSGSKIGISVTMPSNTFTRNGYTFGGWYDSVVNKTYAIGTSVTIDSTRNITVKWNVNELTFSNQSKTITYSESSQSFNISGASNGTGSYSYSIISGDTNGNFGIDGLTISTNKDKVPPTGTYQLTVRAKDINSGKTKDAIITVTIKPATITYTVSSYEGFYDGNSHTISVSVTKPTSGATITYSLTENGTYSATKPTVTNATTTPVTVYFKISASNYNTVSSKATITIIKTNSVSPTLTAYSGTYDGKPHTIGVTGGSGGTIKYSTDQTNWSTTLPTRTDATTTPVTVYVKVFGDGNHKDTSIISSTITINKKTDVITMSSISTNYTGQKVEATATAESKTTITYTYYNGTTCSGTALSSAPVNVGDYSVKATSTGNNNYKSNSTCATIKISNTNNPTTVSAVAGLKYGSTGNLVTTSNVQGTIYYSIGTELTSSNYKTSGSTSIPTASGKNAGTYKVYYYVDATGTNYESTKGGPVSVTIGKAPGSISYATKSVTKDYGNASFVNTLTKTGDGTITSYLSSNTGVATIDTSGKVTINAAGTTTIKATVTDGTNYTYATKTATYTLIVNQIDNTAKVSPVTGIIYGDSKSMVNVSEVQGTIYYSVGTEITEANYLSIGSTTIPASTGRNAGDYNIYYFVKGNSNYKNTSGSVKVTISAKTLSLPVSPNAKTYNGNSQGSGISCPQGSTVGGATSATDAGTYTQTCTLNSTSNYVWSDKTTTAKSISWKINQKRITITASNQTVTYGTAIAQGVSKVSVATLVSGHNLSAITLTQSTTNAPGGTISASGAKIVSGSTDVTGNYAITYAAGTLTINAKTLTIPSNPNEKTYNGNPQGSGITCPAGSTAGGTQSATNQGTYTQTCTLNSTSNYVWNDKTTTAKSISWKIDPKKITITASNQTVTYGTAIDKSTSKVSVATLVSGHNLSAITLTQSTTNAPGGTISASGAKIVSGSTDVTSNYSITYKTGILTINAKALSIPVSPNAKTYNGNSQGSGISCPQGSTVGGATSATNQGTYTQTCTLNSTTNYVWDDTNKTTTPKSISWKIDPKKITITASNQTVTYGTAIDKSTSKVSVATLVSGHNLSAITLTQSTTNAPGGTISASGAKIVSGSTDVTSNYSMTYKTGTLTINPATLSAPTNIKISTAGIVTWDSVSNASSYQISMDNANWTAATSGVDYLSKLIASTGSKTVYVRAVGTGNYSTSNNGTASTIVYTVTVNSNSTTMGTVDTSSYNVISGATYSASSNKLSFIGTTTGSTTKTLKTVTATAKSNYTFNNWSSVSGSITSNVTLTANFNSSEFTISLNPNGGTGGTSAIYERYNKGIYLDSGTNSKQMTTSANAITKPTKEPYTISFNANNTGATVPSNYSFSPVFNGYYTATTSNGTQMIDNRGYITNNLTSTKYTSNTTLYAQWNHYYTLPSLSKGGNTCKWAIGSASGTKYNSGTSLFINDNKVFYAVCTPNKYKVKFEPNGGTSSATEMDVTYDSPYGTLPTVTRSASKVNDITINYVFEGWYDSNGTKITETSIVETPSDHTLYAHWLSSPNIKGGTAESWSSTAVTISLNIPSTSDTGTVSYQYYLSETNELPESATWIDITSADGSVSISKNGEFYIFYKATSSAGVSITSNYNKLQIDTQTPSTSITAYQAGTTTTVASNKWINKNLEFKMGALNVGPSSGSIYYCIGDNCTPNTLISPNTAIPADLTNTKTGIYKVRYKAVSNAGLSSSIGEYVAKVDKTAPTMKAVVKSLKDNSTLANLTNSSTTYIDSTWRSYGYSINLNGTTDSQSGISSIERFTNANNLKRADADYKANLHKGVITDTKTFSESGDGAKYAKFVATDNAGNTTTFTVEVLIDKTAPTVGVNIYKAKDASTKTGSVICALPTSLSNGCKDAFPWTSYGYYFDLSSSSDALSGIDHYTMRYTAGGKSSVDTSSYSSRTISAGTAHTTVTSSGARRLEFTATDKAGNTSTVEAKNVYIDMDDPNLVIKLYKADSSGNKTGSVLKTITDNNTAINSWTNYRHYFDLSGSSDSLSGIEKITMQINDSGIVTTGNTATGTSDLKTTYTITSTKHQVVGSSGNRYARFTITDKVGNTSVKNVRIYIDLDAPTLNSASLSPQFQSSTTIKYTCSDKTSGFASFGTKTLSKTYTKNVTSSNSPVKIQCKDTAGNTSSGTRTYTWSANSDKCGTTTEDVYSNGYYCDAGNAASANSSACISYATNTGKTTKYVNKRCMYYCNAKTGTTTVAKTCWHQ